jgi:hypothetical protein
MRAWPLHVAFACLLIGSLVVKKRSGDALMEGSNLEPAVIRLAQSSGFTYSGFEALDDDTSRSLSFVAPGCAQPVIIALIEDTFDQGLTLQRIEAPGYTRRYVYIDRSWLVPDRRGIFVERIKRMILASLGLTNDVPSHRLLLIDSPPDCHAADAVDWRLVWDRDYLSAAQRGSAVVKP